MRTPLPPRSPISDQDMKTGPVQGIAVVFTPLPVYEATLSKAKLLRAHLEIEGRAAFMHPSKWSTWYPKACRMIEELEQCLTAMARSPQR